MGREDYEGLKEYAKQQHDERVAKTPDRIRYAIQQFEKNNIEYELKNEQIGHFHCRRKCDDKLFQFYAGTGKIQGENRRGIHNLIKILTKSKPQTQYDRLRGMSVEEMAEFLVEIGHTECIPDEVKKEYANSDKSYKDCFVEWLEREDE